MRTLPLRSEDIKLPWIYAVRFSADAFRGEISLKQDRQRAATLEQAGFAGATSFMMGMQHSEGCR
jgi:hypothetical protein